MSGENMQILNMVKEGKITVEEGVKLLEAVEKNNQPLDENLNTNNAKWIKIKVVDNNNKPKVNLTLPISLISIGAKLAEKYSPEFQASGLTQKDLDDIMVAIKSGTTGKIIDIESDKGEKVEIIIE